MRQRFAVVVVLLALGLTWTARIAGQQSQPRRSPGIVDPDRLEAIEPLVRQDIEQKRLPGAVILVGVGDRVVYQKAIGHRALVPSHEPMTLDTIFDLASLTKVIATTSLVMRLVERGGLSLNDPIESGFRSGAAAIAST